MESTSTVLPSNASWPQDAIAEANERFADAKQRELAAGVYGQPAAKERAILDGLDALGDRQAARSAAAEGIIGLLRIAAEEMPLQLSAALEGVLIVRQVVEAITDLEAARQRGAA